MPILSKAQEREERERLGKGMLTSMFGLLFCWLPVLGALLASVGFVKVAARYTRRHRARRRVYLASSTLILIVCVAVLMGEIWLYSRRPTILEDAGAWLLARLSGQSARPAEGGQEDGAPYPDWDAGFDPYADPAGDPDGDPAAEGQEGDIYHVDGAMG